MRLLIYGLNFAPELTGIGKYTGELAAWLAGRGHTVSVIAGPPYYPAWRIEPGYSAWRYRRETWRGVTVIRTPLWVPARPGGLKRLLHLASFAASSLPVLIMQAFKRPDVIFVVAPSLFCAPAAWLAARLCGARVWLHIQDYEVDAAFELGLLKGRGLRKVVLGLERWLLRRFDRVSTISGRMLELARRKGVDARRLETLPNWSTSMPSAAQTANRAIGPSSASPPMPSSRSTPATWASNRASKSLRKPLVCWQRTPSYGSYSAEKGPNAMPCMPCARGCPRSVSSICSLQNGWASSFAPQTSICCPSAPTRRT